MVMEKTRETETREREREERGRKESRNRALASVLVSGTNKKIQLMNKIILYNFVSRLQCAFSAPVLHSYILGRPFSHVGLLRLPFPRAGFFFHIFPSAASLSSLITHHSSSTSSTLGVKSRFRGAGPFPFVTSAAIVDDGAAFAGVAVLVVRLGPFLVVVVGVGFVVVVLFFFFFLVFFFFF